MERKTFEYKAKDGAVYKFAERNRADVSLAKLQNKIRGERVKFIQENIPNEEQQRVLLMAEMGRVYNFIEIDNYIQNDLDEVKKVCFDSFKINQPNVSFAEFEKYFSEDEFIQLREMIIELEFQTPFTDADVRKALKMDEEKFKKFRDEQPAIYSFAKKNLKKK